MKNKKIVTILASIGVISMLVACGSGDDKDNSKEKTSTKTSSTATSTATADKEDEEKEESDEEEQATKDENSESSQQAQENNSSVAAHTTDNITQAQSTDNTQSQQNTTTNNTANNTTNNITSNSKTSNDTSSNVQTTPEVITPTSVYKDGTYSGSGNGFYGSITVSVTISGDKITSISTTDYVTDEYIEKSQGVINNIIASQNTNVDVVSGATFTSSGIISAVNNALSKAKN